MQRGALSNKMKRHELKGEVFGKLRVNRKTASTRSGMSRWECVCECGSLHVTATKHLISGKTSSCGCDRKRGKEHPQWGGIGEMSGDVWSTIVSGSFKRLKIQFTITKEYAWNLYVEQKGRCALSGVELFIGSGGSKRTASLDRIDSSIGYVPENVQWVHKDVNIMKNIYNQEYFIDTCKKISEHKGGGSCGS